MLMTNLILETSRTIITKLDPDNNNNFSSCLVGAKVWIQKTEYTFKQMLQNHAQFPLGLSDLGSWEPLRIVKELPLYLLLQTKPDFTSHGAQWWPPQGIFFSVFAAFVHTVSGACQRIYRNKEAS